jgi:hypothetical protein
MLERDPQRWQRGDLEGLQQVHTAIIRAAGPPQRLNTPPPGRRPLPRNSRGPAGHPDRGGRAWGQQLDRAGPRQNLWWGEYRIRHPQTRSPHSRTPRDLPRYVEGGGLAGLLGHQQRGHHRAETLPAQDTPEIEVIMGMSRVKWGWIRPLYRLSVRRSRAPIRWMRWATSSRCWWGVA